MSGLDPLAVLLWLPPVVLAITGHEVAHGWVARHCGDPTAAAAGRLTLNPLPHVDPVGTLLVPGVLALLGGLVFGWAKPVPVNWQRLRHPRRDMALVALAGPAANLVMILAWIAVIAVGRALAPALGGPGNALIYMGWAGIIINSVLMLLNLVPIPPLDGSRVVTALLPPSLAAIYARVEPAGLIIVLLLLASGLLGRLLGPGIVGIERLAGTILGA